MGLYVCRFSAFHGTPALGSERDARLRHWITRCIYCIYVESRVHSVHHVPHQSDISWKFPVEKQNPFEKQFHASIPENRWRRQEK